MSRVLYLEAPNGYKLNVNSAFLAGGITNCTNWQSIVFEEIQNQFPTFDFKYDIAILNPRRKSFDITNPDESSKQILWEYQGINHYSNVFSVWFSSGPSVQPITLFELGAAFYNFNSENICIGVEPGYCRSFDVYKQIELRNPSTSISSNYKTHATNILTALKRFDFV